MKRMPRIILYGVLILGLLSGSAFAGTAFVNHGAANAAVQLATEALGTNRNCAINRAAIPISTSTAGLTYTFTQNLTSGNLVRVSLVNAAFAQGTVYVVGFNSGDQASVRLASALVPAGGANNISFQLTFPATLSFQAGGNNFLLLTNSNEALDDGTVPVTAASSAVNMTFLSTATSGATATVDIVTSGGITVDSASTVTIAQAGRERTPLLTTNTLWIDYINTPFDGTLFTTASSGASARNMATNATNAFNIMYSAKNVGIGLGANTAGLTARATVNFDSATDWQGVSRAWIGSNIVAPECSVSNNVSNVVIPTTGTNVALNISSILAGGFNQLSAGNLAVPICIETVGNVELRPRTISGGVTVTVTGTGGVTLPETTGILQQWVPNGFTAIIPHMRYGETTRGFIRLVNNGQRTATLIGTIIKSDGTTITGIALGTLAANNTVSLSAQTIGVAQGLGDTADYTLQLSASVSPESIYANAFFNLLSGGVWTTRDNTLYENWKQFIGEK